MNDISSQLNQLEKVLSSSCLTGGTDADVSDVGQKHMLTLVQSLYKISSKSKPTWVPFEWLKNFRISLEAQFGKPLEELRHGEISLTDVGVITGFDKDDWAIEARVISLLYEWKIAKGQTPEVWTASLDYGATGEGRTVIFLAARAYDEAEFLIHVVDKMGYYYAMGADLCKGLPGKDDVAKMLLSNELRQFLEEEIKAATSGGGHIDIELKYHINYS